MKRGEDWLREACAQLAREETDQWERSLTRADLRKAEEAYRRHRSKALSLIRRNTRRQRPVWAGLRVAAVLAVLAAAAYLSLRQPPPDTLPQTQLSSMTAAPYYSPVPTASPDPATIWEIFPTASPDISEINSAIATNTPFIEPTPTVIPTSVPTVPPTAEPTPTADASPTPAPEIDHVVPTLPEGWTGGHFPMGLMHENAAPTVTQGEGWQQATWDGWEFTEYADGRVLDVPSEAAVSYVQWDDIVALRAKTMEGATLIWVQDGHSMRLFTVSGDVEEMAKTVKKISRE